MTKKLFIQAMVKFLSGVLLVGLLIFLPAGTLSFWKGEYSVRIMQLFRTFSAGHPEIRCSDSGCQCSPL